MDFSIDKFSYRLTVLLDEHNMTQTQLAKKIGTSNVTICRYLTGERVPRLDVVTKIADFLMFLWIICLVCPMIKIFKVLMRILI